MKHLRRRLLMALAVLVAAAGAAVAFVAAGIYDVSSTTQHTQAVYSLLELTMNRSVKRQAADIAVPPLDRPGLLQRGGLCFRDKCLQCHGGPGTAQGDIGRSMQPLPGPLVDARSRWSPSELYWITRHGIKMSGMPAWQHRLSDDDLWALVAFMQRLPDLDVPAFGRLAGVNVPGRCEATVASVLIGGMPSAQRGREAMTQYACNACHRIPGVTGSDVHVGPPLAGIASRQLIAGTLPNTSDNMVRWLLDPQAVDALTAMPNMQLSEADARDIAAYLATLTAPGR